jgi:hypothetical protein
MKEVKFTLSTAEYSRLLDIVQELNKVSEVHKIKWLSENILFYSLLAEKETGKVNAVKAFIIKRNDFFRQLPADLELTYIISQGKEWYKKFKFLVEENEDVEITLRYDEKTKAAYTFTAKNSILEITAISGAEGIMKDMPMQFIKEKMNPNIADWSVDITDELFKKIKKIAKLDTSDLLNIKSEESVISLKDDSWELKIGTANVPDNKIFFDKAYLDMITVSPILGLYIFGSYILVKEQDSLLLYNLSMFA